MNTRRSITLTLLLVIILAQPAHAVIKFHQHVTVMPDGSGKMVFKLAFHVDAIAKLFNNQEFENEIDRGLRDRITDHALTQTWNLDPTGNWKGFSNFDQATAADDLVQQRTANAANEITDVTETVGDQWVTPAHDRNGNLTTIPQPADPTSEYDCTYDAWNRLVKVETAAPTTIAEYAYDGINRRIRKYVPGTPDSYQHFYYNNAWQVLETREASTAPVPATAQYQDVWSLRYGDAPVLRDDIAAAPNVRLYYSGDANFNVTSLFDVNGTPVESYVYDPYGKLTIYNADWSATRSTSSYDNSTLYTGQWRDAETELSNYRTRYYHAILGRFLSRDGIGYRAGDFNLYRYVGNSPIGSTDPLGHSKTLEITYWLDGSKKITKWWGWHMPWGSTGYGEAVFFLDIKDKSITPVVIEDASTISELMVVTYIETGFITGSAWWVETAWFKTYSHGTASIICCNKEKKLMGLELIASFIATVGDLQVTEGYTVKGAKKGIELSGGISWTRSNQGDTIKPWAKYHVCPDGKGGYTVSLQSTGGSGISSKEDEWYLFRDLGTSSRRNRVMRSWLEHTKKD